MSMNHKSKSKTPPPYDFILRHYRDPGEGADPVKRWLSHPENAHVICAVLYVNGLPEQDLQDGMQDVFVRALTAFKRGARVPADLREMKAFCAAIAKKYAMATLLLKSRRQRLGYDGPCDDADEHTQLEYGAPRENDTVEAGRLLDMQLAVLAQLFREGCMPDRGLDILEGIARNRSRKQIASDLGITDLTVAGRMRTMVENLRKRSGHLDSPPGMDSLRLVVARPGAIEALRRAS